MTSRKSAIITGSTSGIGLGMAHALARSGMNIMLNGFGNPTEIEAIRAGMASTYNVEVGYHGADMSKPEEIGDLFNTAELRFGAVDVVISNAGIQYVAPVEEFPVEKWNAIIAINLTSAFHLIRHAIPGMKARQWGRIINLCSAHGAVASPFKSAYVAAKHGIMGLTKTVALEVAQAGITVNAINPGYVYTPLVEKQIPDQAKSRGISEDAVRELLLAAQPTKRFVTVEEIGDLAVFLCSDAAKSITGTSIAVDGGWTAQ